MLVCQGPSFYLIFLVKKGQNSKNTPFRVMPPVMQLHLIMISKYSKFGVDTFNTFWAMRYIKVFAWQQQQQQQRWSSDHNSSTFFFKTDELKKLAKLYIYIYNNCYPIFSKILPTVSKQLGAFKLEYLLVSDNIIQYSNIKPNSAFLIELACP